MNSTLGWGSAILTVSVVGVWGLRRLSSRVRVAIDFLLFIAASIFMLSENISPLSPAAGTTFDTDDMLRRAIGAAWWVVGARILISFQRFLLHRDHRLRQTRLFSDLMAGAIYCVTALVVLNSVFALPIRGLLATSGIIAVVLGLALQNTLSDVFSGIAVGIESPFKIGDRIMMNNQIEGTVIQINWRSIRVLTDTEDVAIFPNSMVSKAEIINRSSPTSRRTGSVQVPCSNTASSERIIEILMEAAMLCPAIEKTPQASVALVEFHHRKNVFRISFGAASSDVLGTARDQIVQRCQQNLYYAGLLADGDESQIAGSPRPTETRPSTFDIIKRLVLFESLNDQALQNLANSAELKFLKQGETLFTEGSTDATLHIIASGIVEFTRRSATGAHESIGMIGPGEYIGEIGLLTGTPHGATAVAGTRSHVLQLSKDCIAPLIAKNLDLAGTFDESVKHGMELLKRGSSVHAALRDGSTSNLLVRIRHFFSAHAPS